MYEADDLVRGDNTFFVATGVTDGEMVAGGGRTPVELLEQEIGNVLSEDERREIDTVGGLIFELVGHVPRAGQELQLDGYRVVVERVIRRRVDRVYFERLEALAESGS